jgi:hypothetical protein
LTIARRSRQSSPRIPGRAPHPSYSFAIPNNVAFVGFHVYLQAYAWAPGANPASIVISNGLDWRVGF